MLRKNKLRDTLRNDGLGDMLRNIVLRIFKAHLSSFHPYRFWHGV